MTDAIGDEYTQTILASSESMVLQRELARNPVIGPMLESGVLMWGDDPRLIDRAAKRAESKVTR